MISGTFLLGGSDRFGSASAVRLRARYRAEVLAVPVTYTSMKNKDIDVFLGNWMPTMDSIRKPYLDDKSVEVVATNLEGAKYTLAVPAYTYEAGLLRDGQDRCLVRGVDSRPDRVVDGADTASDRRRNGCIAQLDLIDLQLRPVTSNQTGCGIDQRSRCSNCCTVTGGTFSPARLSSRARSAFSWSRLAWWLAIAASSLATVACRARSSNRNRVSPALTGCPSAIGSSTMTPSIWVRMATDAIGSTQPT
jgi:hypothetical protein